MKRRRWNSKFPRIIGLAMVLTIMGGRSWGAELQTVRLVLPHQVFFDISLPTYVAEEKGFYRDEGIKITSLVASGGGEQIQFLAAGSADIVWGAALFATLSAVQQGAALKIVAAQKRGIGDIYWYAKENSGITKLDDLAGKKVAYSRPGSTSHMVLLAANEYFKSKGLRELIPTTVGSPPDSFTAVMTSQIDAGWSVAPFFLDEAGQGKIRVVFTGENFPRLENQTVRVVLASAKYLKSNPKEVSAFLRANKKAIDYIYANREDAVNIWMKRVDDLKKFPRKALLGTWDFYKQDTLAYAPIRGLDESLKDAVTMGFLKQPMDEAKAKEFIDLGFLR